MRPRTMQNPISMNLLTVEWNRPEFGFLDLLFPWIAAIGLAGFLIGWLVVAIMALSFFGKGIGALGWAVVSDTCPKEIAGLSGGLFNMFGNISSITTPIVIGYIIQNTGSFNGALVFVGANAIVAAFSYLVIVGEIKRLQLKQV